MSVYLVTVGNAWGKHCLIEEAVENAMTSFGRPVDHLTKMNIKEFDCESDKLVMNGLGFEYPQDSKKLDVDIEVTEKMRKTWDRIYDLKVDIDEAMYNLLEPVYEVTEQ